jgi:hypothetical protein
MGIQINGQTDTVTAIDGSITVGTDLTVPGVLTYDDVTNVDSIGIITARSGVHVTGIGASVGIGTDNPAEYLNIFSSPGSGADAAIQLQTTTINVNKARISKENSGELRITSSLGGSGRAIIFETKGSGQTERMRIKANGDVGIGTDDPAGNLHISSGESGDCVLIIEADTDNNEETDNPYIEFRQDGGLAHSKVGLEDNQLIIANSVIAGEGIVFKVGQSGTPGWQQATERVSIGTSETVCTGFYRATNIPFMRANGSPSVPTGSGTETVTSFNTVEQNTNFNSYNNSTGIYTVPVNGLYWASCAITCSHTPTNTSSTLLSLYHSGPGQSGPSTYGANYHEALVTMSAAGVFNCLAGDLIEIRLTNAATIFGSTPRNYFSVAFLG